MQSKKSLEIFVIGRIEKLMSLGFNSTVQLEGAVYHVQTEDRGIVHPFIDTLVLLQGEILHRSSRSYTDMVVFGSVNEEALRARVERQHREILSALRAGSLAFEPSAIAVKLCNAGSWLVAGKAALDVQVLTRRDNRPLPGAIVEIIIEGVAEGSGTVSKETDSDGRVSVSFSVPVFTDPDRAALVIQAVAGEMRDQIRYRLKPKVQKSGASPK
jgi:hypothetical protein